MPWEHWFAPDPVASSLSAVMTAEARRGWTACAAAAVLFGASTPVLSLLVADAGPLTLAGLLYVGAALAVSRPATRRAPMPATAGQRRRLAVAVVAGGGIAPVLLLLALDRSPAGSVSLLLNLELVATALIAWAALHEHIGRRSAGGLVLVSLGGVLLVGSGGAGAAGGALLVAGACACWGLDNALTSTLDGFTPTRIVAVKGIVAGSVNLLLGLVLDNRASISVVAAALVIGAVGYGLSLTLWIGGAQRIGATRGQAVFALAPFVGALMAGPIAGDPLGALGIVAFAVSLAGVVVIATAQHAHRHTHTAHDHAHRHDHDDAHHDHDPAASSGSLLHHHEPVEHDHDHLPDVHHRHEH